jgi:hypothetical protein
MITANRRQILKWSSALGACGALGTTAEAAPADAQEILDTIKRENEQRQFEQALIAILLQEESTSGQCKVTFGVAMRQVRQNLNELQLRATDTTSPMSYMRVPFDQYSDDLWLRKFGVDSDSLNRTIESLSGFISGMSSISHPDIVSDGDFERARAAYSALNPDSLDATTRKNVDYVIHQGVSISTIGAYHFPIRSGRVEISLDPNYDFIDPSGSPAPPPDAPEGEWPRYLPSNWNGAPPWEPTSPKFPHPQDILQRENLRFQPFEVIE